ncbi:MAG: hypothetical protein LBI04_05265 [Treponema sp.]|jgi:hypothetical protein|nr:hypothetical protein [Treponema sp.]
MNRLIIAKAWLIMIVVSFLLSSCNKEKITEQERIIEDLNSQILLLKAEIDIFKETDQYYYQSGTDEFINKNYKSAIDWMNNLIIKFPTSELLIYAEKIKDVSLKILKSRPIDASELLKEMSQSTQGLEEVLEFIRKGGLSGDISD